MAKSKKIFFIGSDIPYPGNTGGSAINWSAVNYLISKGHKLTIFSDPPLGGTPINENLRIKMLEKIQSLNCDYVSLHHLKKKIKKKNFFERLFSNNIKDYYPECNFSGQIEEIIKEKIQEIKPDLILCYGSPAIYHVKNINYLKAGWCDPPRQIYIERFKIFMESKNKTLKGLIFHIIMKIKLFFFQNILIKEFNKLNFRFQASKDHVDFLNKHGANLCKHISHPFYDTLNGYNKKNNSKNLFFKVLIVGRSSTSVNQSQISVLMKYVFPEIEKNNLQEKIQFHFIGDEKNDLPIEIRNKKYVVARGYVNDLVHELIDCDLFFCVTAHKLGYRVRISDALSCGACILTSKFDQYSYPFLKDKDNCYIVNDLKKTGLILIDIFLKQEKKDFISLNARKTYIDYLSYNSNYHKFEDKLFELLEN